MTTAHLVFVLVSFACVRNSLSSQFCQFQSDCPANAQCIDYRCRGLIGFICTFDQECHPSYRCVANRCAIPGSNFCRTSLDCLGSRRCIFNECRFPVINGVCEGSFDCVSSQVCRYNVCKDVDSTPVIPIIFGTVCLAIALIIAALVFRRMHHRNQRQRVLLSRTPATTYATGATNTYQHQPQMQAQWTTAYGQVQQMPSTQYTSSQAMPVDCGPIGPQQQFDSHHAPPTYDSVTGGCAEPSAPPPYNPHMKK